MYSDTMKTADTTDTSKANKFWRRFKTLKGKLSVEENVTMKSCIYVVILLLSRSS